VVLNRLSLFFFHVIPCSLSLSFTFLCDGTFFSKFLFLHRCLPGSVAPSPFLGLREFFLSMFSFIAAECFPRHYPGPSLNDQSPSLLFSVAFSFSPFFSFGYSPSTSDELSEGLRFFPLAEPRTCVSKMCDLFILLSCLSPSLTSDYRYGMSIPATSVRTFARTVLVVDISFFSMPSS